MDFFANWWWVIVVLLAVLPLVISIVRDGWYEVLSTLDRRWVFLYMMLAVAIPILQQTEFPEKPTGLAENVFLEVEKLQEGDKILMAFDFDPASEGELGPMATTAVYHACKRKLKIYFLALWPVGPQMVDDNIRKVIKKDFPQLKYGVDYVNLGYKAGDEGVIKVIVTDLKQLYTTDSFGAAIDSIPMMEGVNSLRDFDLIWNVSAGYPGTKEWVIYGVTPFPDDVRMVAGCTGVQAPLLYPYIPQQLPGMLAAIKGASEYEQLVMDAYFAGDDVPGRYTEARRRMGPQLVAHVLIIALIVVGNVIFFVSRKKGARA